MSSHAAETRTMTVTLEERERAELLALAEHALGETRVEVHHTHTPDFREQVKRREEVLRSIIAKLRRT